MKRTQKNKATEGHLGHLKAKIAKLRTEVRVCLCCRLKKTDSELDMVALNSSSKARRPAVVAAKVLGSWSLLLSCRCTTQPCDFL